MDEQLVKSKDRVKQHGEVFTPANIVNDMLDMVDSIDTRFTYNIEKTVLEPACGNGNFLIQILARKLKSCREAANNNKELYDFLVFKTLCSIYAIDIQRDNVLESRERLLQLIVDGTDKFNENHSFLCSEQSYETVTGEKISDRLLKIYKFILNRNIIHGDGIEGIYYKKGDIKTTNSLPIIITEWKITDDKVQLGEQTLKNCDVNNENCNTYERIYRNIEWYKLGNEIDSVSKLSSFIAARTEINKLNENIIEANKERLAAEAKKNPDYIDYSDF